MSGNWSTLALSAGMGAVAGMRSMAAPALLSHRLSQQPERARGHVARLLATDSASRILAALAAGEAAGDKTTHVPDRTDLTAVLGRAFSGGITGAAIAGRRGESTVGPALAGAATAVASTFVTYHARREAARRLNAPDPVFGAIEDLIVLVLGSALVAAIE